MTVTDDAAETPSDRVLEGFIIEQQKILAEAEEYGTPGTTRIELVVPADGDSRVRRSNRNADVPLTPDTGEVVLSKIAESHDWHEEAHHEWWRSGKGVQEQGIDFFDEVRRADE